MSEENVAVLRAVYAAWTKGNLEPGGQLYAPDATFAPIADGRDSFDRQGFRRFMREFLEQWDDFRVEGVEFLDLGDKVLVTERQRATGKRSGIEMEQTDYAVWTFRDGLVTAVCWEIDPALAKEAAELSE
jgi:ketosteroid isomerase-like protein